MVFSAAARLIYRVCAKYPPASPRGMLALWVTGLDDWRALAFSRDLPSLPASYSERSVHLHLRAQLKVAFVGINKRTRDEDGSISRRAPDKSPRRVSSPFAPSPPFSA